MSDFTTPQPLDATNWHERPPSFEVGPQPLEELTASVGYVSPPLNYTALALVSAELARLLGLYVAGTASMDDEPDALAFLDEFDRLRAAIVREAVAS